jgi:hypothetical protein
MVLKSTNTSTLDLRSTSLCLSHNFPLTLLTDFVQLKSSCYTQTLKSLVAYHMSLLLCHAMAQRGHFISWTAGPPPSCSSSEDLGILAQEEAGGEIGRNFVPHLWSVNCS